MGDERGTKKLIEELNNKGEPRVRNHTICKTKRNRLRKNISKEKSWKSGKRENGGKEED